jgi:hypothetical protein
MFADAEHVEPHAIGDFDLLHKVGEGLVDADRFAGQRVAPGFDESVDAEFHQGPSSPRVIPVARRP